MKNEISEFEGWDIFFSFVFNSLHLLNGDIKRVVVCGKGSPVCREAGNKDENIAGFIAVLIIKSIKYGPANEMGKIADSRESVYLFYEN